MNINCPNCNRVVEQNSPPIRGPAGDGSEAWLCLKCPAVVCSFPIMKTGDEPSVPCYIEHAMKAHPEMYQPVKKPTAGRKKGKKGKK